jgi:hypothetical protein
MRIEDKGGSSCNYIYKISVQMEKLLMQYVEMRHFRKNTDVPLDIGIRKIDCPTGNIRMSYLTQ